MIAIANHLWQSTFFACVTVLFAFGLRKNRASVRYWLWLVASVKFLVPLSLLITLGSQLQWQGARPVDPPPLHAIHQIRLPLAMLASPARSLAA